MHQDQSAEPRLDKTYSPSDSEQHWYAQWEDQQLFAAQADEHGDPTKSYSVLMPPPNVTGMLTMGHVLNNTIQDIYVRWNRIKGKNVCWFPGLDHAGIATQTKVEKQIAEEGLSRHDLGREPFLEKVWEWKDKYGGIILEQLRSLGVSCDWNRTLFTMDEKASKAVQEVFVRLFDDGLIYRGKRIVNWSPVAQSALSDEEVIFREVSEHIYTMRYVSEDGNTTLHVATVRPETIFGDVAVAVNPNDERYKHLIGTKVRVPLVNRLVPIVADDYADPEFGTGAVKITPAHDPNDFYVGERHNLEMPNTINPDGKLNELAGPYAGMDRFDARKKIIEDLQAADLMEKIEDYTHNVGYSERGGEPIEPYLSDQWFVKMEPLAQPALAAVRDGEVKFYPEHWTKTYEHWMTNIRDWCISRQLWWGHRIPVYYSEEGAYTAARNEQEAREKLDGYAGVLRQDEDVLDTWFSSWLWPMTTMNWLVDGEEETKEMQTWLPSDLLVTAPDIIFFWVARMIMASLKFKGKIPFKDVYFTSLIRDAQGRKMSKSLGNSPDPLEIIGKYGADAVRFTVIYSAPIGQDIRLEVNKKTQDIATMEIGRNFANKIWNAARFLDMKRGEANFETADLPDSLDMADTWIANRFNDTLAQATKALDDYKLHEYARHLHEFIWSDFCSWYVEIVKLKSYRMDSDEDKRTLINFAFDIFQRTLRLLHPVMPYLTEELWHRLEFGGNMLSVESAPTSIELPQADQPSSETADFGVLMQMVESVRAFRGSMNVPPHEKPKAIVSSEHDSIQQLAREYHHIFEGLARLSDITVTSDSARPDGYVAVVLDGVQVFVELAGIIDIDAEIERISKEIQRLQGLIKGTEKKLSNEKFVANAPEAVVAGEREKLESFKGRISSLESNLSQLTS